MRKLTSREAVARVFPSYDLEMADRVITWLDRCGYQIVEKDQVSVVPPDPASQDHLQDEPALHYVAHAGRCRAPRIAKCLPCGPSPTGIRPAGVPPGLHLEPEKNER
jgi:hypothetical protein